MIRLINENAMEYLDILNSIIKDSSIEGDFSYAKNEFNELPEGVDTFLLIEDNGNSAMLFMVEEFKYKAEIYVSMFAARNNNIGTKFFSYIKELKKIVKFYKEELDMEVTLSATFRRATSLPLVEKYARKYNWKVIEHDVDYIEGYDYIEYEI